LALIIRIFQKPLQSALVGECGHPKELWLF